MTLLTILLPWRTFLWMAVAYVMASAIEYFPHRWVMHSRALAHRIGSSLLIETFERHATLHHARYFGPRAFDECDDPAARYISMKFGVASTFVHLLWLGVPLAFVSLRGAIVIVAFLAAHSACWTAVHREMHFPKGRWFSRTTLYGFWREWHQAHHEQAGKNFNILCPLFDFIFGTVATK